LQHRVCSIGNGCIGFDRDYLPGHDLMCAH
jgi:hypothetical protein